MRVLMCPPDYYGIYYEINPWMSRANAADQERAQRQWNNLYELYHRLGVKVDLVPAVEGLPDMVFTANAGLVEEKRCVIANFRHPQRKGEEPYFKRWFEEHGYEIFEPPQQYSFEGAGDAKFVGRSLFAGFHFRSDAKAYGAIGDFLHRRVIPVELVQSRFYHLDTCFAVLDDTSVMYFPEAFAGYSHKVITHYIPSLLPIELEDAMSFACNCVVVGQNLILNRASAGLRAALASRGFAVHEVDLSEFMKAGGSAGCLTLILEP